VITTDNSDWATNCPEYKVTAVQVTKVTQPSEWQRRYQRFNTKQTQFYDHRQLEGKAATAAVTAPLAAK